MDLDLSFGGGGLTPNDDGDVDTGPNGFQNFPVLTSVSVTNTDAEVMGMLDSQPSITYRVEFFGNDAIDPSNYGEGKTFLGASDVTTDASGHAAFDLTFPLVPGSLRVTSIATDPSGNTSEFSTSVGQLLNISTRLRVLGGDNVLIGGFIVVGAEPKKVLVRGIGPSLGNFGVGEPLADPTLELHSGTAPFSPVMTTGKPINKSRSKRPCSNRRMISSRSSLRRCRQTDGAGYTAIVRGKNGTTGVGLVEAYDLDSEANSKLANISTRGFVDTGDNVLIGGFILSGGSGHVIVRAIGPSLTDFGVMGALQNPTLELHDGFGNTLSSNDDWKESQQTEIMATGLQPSNDLESAIDATLPPGGYTAIVRGKNDTSGVGLVEIYRLNLGTRGQSPAGQARRIGPGSVHGFCFLEILEISVRAPLPMILFPVRRHLLPALLLPFALAAFTPVAHGYALEKTTWPSGTVLTLQMQLGPLNQTLRDGSQSWNEAAVPAIAAWNAEMKNVQLAAVMDSTVPISSGDGVNSVFFDSKFFGQSFGTGVLAVTYYSYQGSTFQEADIIFNTAQSFDSYRDDLIFDSKGKCVCDIQRVFLHELGHALGLNHPDGAGQQVDAIMNSVVSNASQLTVDDQAGIHSLYGTPVPNPTPTPTPSPETPSRLVNISTRMRVGLGEEVLIGGFIIQGDQLKKVILRAIGPSLTAAGVTGALADPKMELRDSAGGFIDGDDDWQESLDSGEIISSGLAPSDPNEAAVVARLAPGSYTVIVSGANNTSGIGLVESYTLDTSATHAANISTRGRVGTGDEALIGGFIVGGQTSKTIIVRALGPSLGTLGVAGALADPAVELHNGDGALIASNDNWNESPQQSEISASGFAPSDARECALLATLAPGGYTAIVRGADGGEGIGLVEIYDLDQ